MSGLEPFEMPPGYAAGALARDRVLRRVGWAILAINAGRPQIAERHLAEAVHALQEMQRNETEELCQ